LARALAWRVRRARTEGAQFRVRLRAWLECRRRISRYRRLTERELRGTKKSDTIFIFGSGASLNDIPAAEWQNISAHDTLGFNCRPSTVRAV
jgi:hypothetical protein